jgi:hypothetical protein
MRVERVHFSPDSDDLTLGTGIDMATSEPTRFVVPPEAVLGVLASSHAGEKPLIEVHEIDIVDWTMWWEEV